jgi:hypothetical protein
MALDAELIWYLTWRTEQEGTRAAKTRLIKLLYLVDLRYARREGQQATSFRWRFYHYGPYPFGVEEVIERQLDRTIAVVEIDDFYGESVQIYRAVDQPPDDLLPTATQLTADQVCREWALEDLNDLLSFVYFETPPMREAQRGDWLDLRAGIEQRWPVHYQPLGPPDVSAELLELAGSWRERFERAFPSQTFEPPTRPIAAAPSEEVDVVYGPDPGNEVLASFNMTVDPAIEREEY